MRLWIESKVQPSLSPFDELQTPGGGAQGQQLMPLRENLEASARYLFFIEKRNALNALLELVQARIGLDLSEVSS